ncbi:TPA: heavy metal translocating P-type ATPase [Candidatus Wolfebacteria bacterium]|nr:heavy metal translocating P-type ATPase [Candidatus Wolfebacteria bacterium]
MHPEITSETPGNCPKCGMGLVLQGSTDVALPGAIPHASDKHAGHTAASFLRKFWIGLLLSIPVVLYSELPEVLLGVRMPTFPGMQYLGPLLGSIIFFYGGWIFLIGAVNEIRAKLPGMMTLISLAIVSAYTYSMYVFAIGATHALFWELATLITIMLLGHYLEMRSIDTAQHALRELAALLPDTAEIMVGQVTRGVTLAELNVNDLVIVKPGGKIPADGVVIEGESQVNESMMTGESKPVEKKVNSTVVAGTINGDGRLVVAITRIGEGTFLAGVMRLVAGAQTSKSRLQVLADKTAFYLTGIAIVTALSTLFIWLSLDKGTAFAMERFIAVLVVACPHALGLAVPLVVAISTSIASRNGLFIKDRLALEAARTIDIVLFDKTGTLTEGAYGVNAIIPLTNTTTDADKQATVAAREQENILRLAASLDFASEHPVSRAIAGEAMKRGIELFPVTHFVRVPGKGVRGIVRGMRVEIGGESLVGSKMIDGLVQDVHREIALLAGKGQTIVYVMADDNPIGVIALADIIRPEAKEAIVALKRLGIKPVMVTGDAEEVAEWVAQDVGIAEYFFRVSPHDKVEKIKAYQEKGLRVAMVGDGVNDAAALMQANVGIAIGAGTNVAIESAGIVLAKNDPRDVVKIIRLARLTYRKMVQNLFWAAGYNVIAIPLAAGALYAWGIVLSPAISAIFMSVSTIIVAANALLLRRNGQVL